MRILFTTLKDTKNPRYKTEQDLLSRMAAEPMKETQVPGPAQRVLMEMVKQKLVQLSAGGWRLTPLGSWYITHTME